MFFFCFFLICNTVNVLVAVQKSELYNLPRVLYLLYSLVIYSSYFKNVFAKGQLVSECHSCWSLQFLPKNKQKQVDLRYPCSSKVEFIFSFFGSIHGLKIYFRVLLTFRNSIHFVLMNKGFNYNLYAANLYQSTSRGTKKFYDMKCQWKSSSKTITEQ